jgi:DNA-directed RNA polymerase specialized sigma24 family protein
LSPFRPRKEHELNSLSDEALIAYANAARSAGEHQQWRTAISVLVFGFERRVRFWVGRKVDAAFLEDLVGEVFERALTSLSRDTAKFEGSTPGELGAWLRQISAYVVADHTERVKRDKDHTQSPSDNEDEFPERQVPDPHGDDFTNELVNRELVKEAFDAVTNETHRKAIELAGPADYGFKDLSAEETVTKINAELGPGQNSMTEQNVYKIVSRFRERLEQLRDEADG